MRLVLDTNTIVSGLIWRGIPGTVIDLARGGGVTLITSVALLAELDKTLNGRKLSWEFTKRGLEPSELLRIYRDIATMVAAPPLPSPVCRDPDDDAVIAAAIAGEADAIVTGDSDLLVLRDHEGIAMMRAAQIVELLKPDRLI